MVFTNNNSSYLPLDSDQRLAFYKNENLLFPPLPLSAAASVTCRRSNSSTIMPSVVTAAAVEDHTIPNTTVHHSSNGYYGYVPVNSIPKVLSTGTAATTISGTIIGNADGVSVQLDRLPPANDDTMMDCMDDSEMENYHQQSHPQRKRKEHLEEAEISCKRRKPWLEQHPNQHHSEGIAYNQNWNQTPTTQMEITEAHQNPMCHPGSTNGLFTNGFYHAVPPSTTSTTTTAILQQKSKYSETSRCMMSHMI